MTPQHSASKLALGTVQFGLAYGIANASGQVPPTEVAEILATARDGGIDTLDTAIHYGESERVLGRTGISGFRVVTKIGEIPEGVVDVRQWMSAEIGASLGRLRVSELEAVLLHRPAQLMGPRRAEILDALDHLKQTGRARKVGLSIYDANVFSTGEELHVDVVQAPLSVFDQRLCRAGLISRLAAGNVEFHARSIFLQGLLLLPPSERPAPFAVWGDAWRAWDAWLAFHGLTPLQACLRFAVSTQGVARAVVGVDSAQQLRQILAASEGLLPDLPEVLSRIPAHLLNPANWRVAGKA